METNRVNPENQPDVPEGMHLIPINIIDVFRQFAQTLNHVPIEDVPMIISSVCGTFSENITQETWDKILANKVQPCGEVDCECHIHANRFLPELYNLKAAAVEAQARVRDKEGRGLN